MWKACLQDMICAGWTFQLTRRKRAQDPEVSFSYLPRSPETTWERKCAFPDRAEFNICRVRYRPNKLSRFKTLRGCNGRRLEQTFYSSHNFRFPYFPFYIETRGSLFFLRDLSLMNFPFLVTYFKFRSLISWLYSRGVFSGWKWR